MRKKYVVPEIQLRRFLLENIMMTSGGGTGGNEGGESPDGMMYSDVNSYMEDEEELELQNLLDL